MYNQNYFNPYSTPINVPSQRTYINPLNGRKSMPMRTLIQKAERSVDTINSIIPLYKKAQPLIEQGKTMFNSITSFFKPKEKEITKKEVKKEKVEVEIVEPNDKTTTQEAKTYDYRVNETNSKPFFV